VAFIVTVVLACVVPSGSGVGLRVDVLMGAVLSILTVTVVDALFPAPSTAVPVTVWIPSDVRVVGPEQL
jgi:hypothetical protein